MSADTWDKFNEIDTFRQKHGSEGIRILMLFKLLKIEVKANLKISVAEETLNSFCIEKAQELVQSGEGILTESDIKEILIKLKQ
jgi:hypothetical protein